MAAKRRSNLAFVRRRARLGIDPEMAGEVGDGEQKIADLVLDPVLSIRMKRLL